MEESINPNEEEIMLVEEVKSMSKKQQKKLLKRERWLKHKPFRKAKEKEKRRLKVESMKLLGQQLGPSRKALKANKMALSPCQLRIAFDMSFDKLMTHSEMSKTLKQLHRCYSMNRRAIAPLQLYITGFSDATKSTLDKYGFTKWDCHIKEELYSAIFEKENIVYLTSDSPNIIDKLDYSRVYVIGALVDHNRLKGICHTQALKVGVNHAKLPLDEYMEMKSRKVLTIDQVYNILLKFTVCQNWSEVFTEILPQRKGAITKIEEM